MKNPFKVEIPEELKTKKARTTYWILWHIYLTDLGRGHVFGKFTQLFTEISLLLLVLDKVGIVDIRLFVIIMSAFLCAILIWLSGWLYQYHDIDRIQNLVSTRRNPMWKHMYDELKGGGKG